MNWDSLIYDAAETITDTFGQSAIVDDTISCRVIIDVIPQSSGGVYEQIIEDRPVAIFLKSEIQEGLISGVELVLENGELYIIEGVSEERTNKHHIAYWVKKVEE